MSDPHAGTADRKPYMTFYHDGQWQDTPPMILGPMDHAMWFGSAIFDGSRSFGGLAPDLDRHCERAIRSAKGIGLNVTMTAEELFELCKEGVRRLPEETETYIRPMFFPVGKGMVTPPDSYDWFVAIHEIPMPPDKGFSACLSEFRRPARDMAPTDSKASCLYPNSIRALRSAGARGFDNAVMLDPNGNVAEYTNANLWLAKDGVAKTPAINGTFLNGITRQRVAKLLEEDGIEVQETVITFQDVLDADEVFNSGNMAKVQYCTRIEDRNLQPGPVYKRARELYFDWAKSTSVF